MVRILGQGLWKDRCPGRRVLYSWSETSCESFVFFCFFVVPKCAGVFLFLLYNVLMENCFWWGALYAMVGLGIFGFLSQMVRDGLNRYRRNANPLSTFSASQGDLTPAKIGCQSTMGLLSAFLFVLLILGFVIGWYFLGMFLAAQFAVSP
jgi:hypothetical protein